MIKAILKFANTLDGLAFVSWAMPYRPRDLWAPDAPFPPTTLVEITTDCEATIELWSDFIVSLGVA